MKIVKMACILLCLIMCVSFTGCVNNLTDAITPPPWFYDPTPSPVPTQAPLDITPVLYKISDDSGSSVWIFSSLSCDEEFFAPLPEYVMNAFNNSKSFAVEYDRIAFNASSLAQRVALSYMLYPEGVTTKTSLSPSVYDKAVEIIGDNVIYTDKYDRYIAAYWANMIDSYTSAKIGDDTQQSVEKYFTAKAKDDDKNIVEMELFDLNFKIMSSFSPELQEAILEASIDSYYNSGNAIEDKNKLLDAWLKGDSESLKELSVEKMVSGWDEGLKKEYTDKKYGERNDTMVSAVEKALAEGEETFFCVIYTNVFSENGIINMLKQKGYTVETIKG